MGPKRAPPVAYREPWHKSFTACEKQNIQGLLFCYRRLEAYIQCQFGILGLPKTWIVWQAFFSCCCFFLCVNQVNFNLSFKDCRRSDNNLAVTFRPREYEAFDKLNESIQKKKSESTGYRHLDYKLCMIETPSRLKIEISKSWESQKKKAKSSVFQQWKNDGRALNPLNIQIFIC